MSPAPYVLTSYPIFLSSIVVCKATTSGPFPSIPNLARPVVLELIVSFPSIPNLAEPSTSSVSSGEDIPIPTLSSLASRKNIFSFPTDFITKFLSNLCRLKVKELPAFKSTEDTPFSNIRILPSSF